jgi:Ca2+-binding RTX toxin-like protein
MAANVTAQAAATEAQVAFDAAQASALDSAEIANAAMAANDMAQAEAADVQMAFDAASAVSSAAMAEAAEASEAAAGITAATVAAAQNAATAANAMAATATTAANLAITAANATSFMSANFAGGDGNDTLTGGMGNDLLSGDAGNDILRGQAGADELRGGAGDDWIEGGTGADVINGGDNGPEGDTVSFHNSGTSVVVDLSTAANATIGSGTALFGGETDTLTGIENIEGGFDADTLTGDAGRNMLHGLGGNDTLIGGDGADFLEGGEGSDVFKYSAGDSDIGLGVRDQVHGFNTFTGGTADADKFDLSGFVTTASGTLNFVGDETNAFTGEASARFNASTKVLEIDTDNDQAADMEIELTNVSGTLSDDDFIVGGGA